MPWVYRFLCVVLVGVIPCCQDGWGEDTSDDGLLEATYFRHATALERVCRYVQFVNSRRAEPIIKASVIGLK